MERPAGSRQELHDRDGKGGNMATMFAPAHARLTTPRQPRICGFDRHARTLDPRLSQPQHVMRIAPVRILASALR
jgi:hypothetical protein